MAKLAAECIRETAGAGGVVIVGRGASSILSGFPGAFHLFVFASTARRKRWVEEHVPGADAGRLLQRVDGNRARYVREHYGHAWDDHRLYHLMLNSCMGLESMLLATLAAAGEDPSRWPGRDRRSECGPAGSSRGAPLAAGGMGAGLA
jgi:cytidylate kinase